MDGLREQDLRAALQVLQAVSAAGADLQSYARAGVAALLVSFVLNRKHRDFSDRDCAALELVRGPLAQMYRQVRAVERAHAALAGLMACLDTPEPPLLSTRFDAPPLTAREREVMHWLATGKTDREIAALLGCSHRTVQKHLEHAYEKLGVETRTAAVMRALDTHLH